MQRPTIHLVSGPSSVGKSRYIESHRAGYADVLFPDTLTAGLVAPGGRYALHYNMLRPYDRLYMLRREGSLGSRMRAMQLARRIRRGDVFDADPPLGLLWSIDADVTATVLVVSRSELERRMRDRVTFEPLSSTDAGYGSDKWLDVLGGVDLDRLYGAWIAYLETRSVPLEVVAADGDYGPIDRTDIARVLEGAA